MKNRYAGKCTGCGANVPANRGDVAKRGNVWILRCAACGPTAHRSRCRAEDARNTSTAVADARTRRVAVAVTKNACRMGASSGTSQPRDRLRHDVPEGHMRRTMMDETMIATAVRTAKQHGAAIGAGVNAAMLVGAFADALTDETADAFAEACDVDTSTERARAAFGVADSWIGEVDGAL